MKAVIIKVNDRDCLLSEISRKYIGARLVTLHRNSKKNEQRCLCNVIGNNSIRQGIISDISEQVCVRKMKIISENHRSTKIFLIIDSTKICKTLYLINKTMSFGKDIMLYKHGIEEWVIYSETIENLKDTIKYLKSGNLKVKTGIFFDLPTDVMFSRSFDLLSNMNLTKRQLEILKAAWTLGYYDKQKKVNLTDIARKFGISEPTIWESLRYTEYKIMLKLSDYFLLDLDSQLSFSK